MVHFESIQNPALTDHIDRVGRIIFSKKEKTKMKIIKKTLILGCIFLLAGCAGVPFFPSAAHEFEKGLGFFNQGQFEQATSHFIKATELDPEYGNAYLYLGRSYLNLGQWHQAIQPLRVALRLSPAETRKEALNFLIDAFFGGALAEMKIGNFQNAVSYLKEGLELNPDSIQMKNQLGQTLIAYGGKLLAERNISEAVTTYKEAIGILPKNIEPYIGIARAFLEEGEFLKALQYVKEAETIDPNSSVVQSMLIDLLKNNSPFGVKKDF